MDSTLFKKMENNYTKIVALLNKNSTEQKNGDLDEYNVKFSSENDLKEYAQLAGIKQGQLPSVDSEFKASASSNLVIKAGQVYKLNPKTIYHFETITLLRILIK
jgi:hypothetical protein